MWHRDQVMPRRDDTFPVVPPPIEPRDPKDAAFWADRLPVYGHNKIVGSFRVGDRPGCVLPGKPEEYEPWLNNGYVVGWQPKRGLLQPSADGGP